MGVIKRANSRGALGNRRARTILACLTGSRMDRKSPAPQRSAMRHIVYKITHRRTGRAYIGITSASLETRWYQHRHAARRNDGTNNGQPIVRALREDGPDAFRIEALAEAASRAQALELEHEAIQAHGTAAPAGYNTGTTRPPDTRARHRALLAAARLEAEARQSGKAAQDASADGPRLALPAVPWDHERLILAPDGAARPMAPEGFRAWRKATGWTQQQAAAMLGISRATLQAYESPSLASDGWAAPIPRSVQLACYALHSAVLEAGKPHAD